MRQSLLIALVSHFDLRVRLNILQIRWIPFIPFLCSPQFEQWLHCAKEMWEHYLWTLHSALHTLQKGLVCVWRAAGTLPCSSYSLGRAGCANGKLLSYKLYTNILFQHIVSLVSYQKRKMKNLPKGHKMQQKAELYLAEGGGGGECLLLDSGMKTN